MSEPSTLRVAVVQMNSGSDQKANLARLSSLLDEAGKQRCDLLLLPENFAFMGADERDKFAVAEDQESSSVLAFLSELARKHRTVIVGGSLPLKGVSRDKVRNSCPVFSAAGELIACYDKIHLFDATLPDKNYHESEGVEGGASPETVRLDSCLDGWMLGLSICYDLRFPELYRHYSKLGCNILTVPAAFTVPTGKAHWEVLLRARAIENQAYVLASGQCGTHPGGRKTYGHSMIIDPWGEVLASSNNGEGVIRAELTLNNLHRIRESMPALKHRRI